MENIILFDSELRNQLLPLTYLRPVSELRVGILSIREKWEHALEPGQVSHITAEHIEPQYPIHITSDNLLINSALIPSSEILHLIKSLRLNQAILCGDELIATRLDQRQFDRLLQHDALEALDGMSVGHEILNLLTGPGDILDFAAQEIEADIKRLQYAGPLQTLVHKGEYPIYAHEPHDLSDVVLDTSEGPIYLGPRVTLLAGARVKGPVAIGAGSVCKMGAEIYGPTAVGPKCVVSGEIKRSSLQGYSNKSHAGYLGDSVIGQWCNLGALTTISNLKNSFGNIRQWQYAQGKTVELTGNKFGVIMGDYSRTAILQRVGAGTVIGVSCNVMRTDVCSGFVPSFTWADGGSEYDLDKACEAARALHDFKDESWTHAMEDSFRDVYRLSLVYRDANAC